jgi:membrane-bound lytic murein transglycosylase D
MRFATITFGFLCWLMLPGCAEIAQKKVVATALPPAQTITSKPVSKPLAAPDNPGFSELPLANSAPSVWQRATVDLDISLCDERPGIMRWAKTLSNQPQRLESELWRAAPYVDWILRQAAMVNVPAQVVLVPFVETDFRQVIGPGGPAGWWQLTADTARRYGLTVNAAQDQRFDPIASTTAALKMLKEISPQFDRRWPLVIAAYNAGPYRLKKILQSKNLAASEVDDYRILPLPKTTLEHLDRMHAYACIFMAPQRFGLELPELEASRRLEIYSLENDSTTPLIAQALGIQTRAFMIEQPLFGARSRIPRGSKLLLPGDFSMRYAQLSNEQINAALSNSVTRTNTLASPANTEKSAGTAPMYVVKSGDNLWAIARKLRVRLSFLMHINGLQKNSRLQIGQKLRIGE